MTMTTTPDSAADSSPKRTNLLFVEDFDATPYLVAILVALYGISARQVVGPLGAIGQPALLLTAGAALLWVVSRTLPRRAGQPALQPLKWALFVYVWYELATIAIAHTRSLSALEQSGAARAAFVILSMAGLALLVIDGIPTMERLNWFLRALTIAVGFLAVIGILQFLFGGSFQIKIPGLGFNQDPTAVQMRSAFNRPMGTALHPIEFGVVLGAMLPLALHYALEWQGTKRQRQISWVVALLIGFAVPLSISRSAIVAVVASMFLMWFGWTWRRRGEALIVLAMWLPMVWVTVPGLLGTFRGMFTSFGQDPSVTARVDRIPIVMQMIRERPWFGLGSGTMSMEEGLLLDNQVWGTILGSGILGFLVLLGLILLSMIMAISSQYHRYATKETRHLGYAIAAAIFGFAVSFGTFDALFFRILLTTLFILFGAAGALWRLTRLPAEAPAASTDPDPSASRSGLEPLTPKPGQA